MNGNGFGSSSSSRSGADTTTNSSAFQQGRFYSGGYALPGVFGDAGQTPGGFSTTTAAAVGGASRAGVGTSTPMVLANTPPRPPAASSVSWGGSAPAAPRVLFAPGFGQQQLHSEVREVTPLRQHVDLVRIPS